MNKIEKKKETIRIRFSKGRKNGSNVKTKETKKWHFQKRANNFLIFVELLNLLFQILS